MSQDRTPRMDTPNLAELLQLAKDTYGLSLSDMEKLSGGAISRGRIGQILTSGIVDTPTTVGLFALAKAGRLPVTEVFMAAGRSIGVPVDEPRPRVVRMIGPEADVLTTADIRQLLQYLQLLIDNRVRQTDAADTGAIPLGKTRRARRTTRQ